MKKEKIVPINGNVVVIERREDTKKANGLIIPGASKRAYTKADIIEKSDLENNVVNNGDVVIYENGIGTQYLEYTILKHNALLAKIEEDEEL
jgi:co-chaperonin GroES (HSP10)